VPTIAEALNFGMTHHRAGRLDVAEQVYRQITQQVPNHPDAWHLLGVIAQQLGQFAESLVSIDRAIQLAGEVAPYHSNRGETLRKLGRLSEAEQSLRRAIALDPAMVDAHNNLGLLLNSVRRHREAVDVLDQAIALRPDFPEALNNRGLARRALGDSNGAIADFAAAIQSRPSYAEPYHNWGTELHRLRQLAEAEQYYRKALAIRPDYIEALNALGLAVHEQGRIDESESLLRAAIQHEPSYAGAHANLGMVLMGQRRLAEAQVSFEQAKVIEPRKAAHRVGLASALAASDQLGSARDELNAALALDPNSVDTWQQLGNVSLSLADVEGAIVAFHKAVALDPNSPSLHSSLLFTELYDAEATPERLFESAAEYDRRHVQPLLPKNLEWSISRDANRRLRIGFVSPDLREHPVGFLMEGVLEQLDRLQFETICYVDHRRDDPLAQQLRAAAGTWRVVDQQTDDELAEIIRRDEVDMLIDLAGHSVPNRLPVFARRPAPVQVSWIGYPGTTGNSAIDFLLCDRWLIPSGDEHAYRERVVRLPDSNICLAAAKDMPEPSPPPSIARGYVTLGAFLNPAKLNQRTIQLWAAVMQRLPDARLLLKYRGLHEPLVRDRLIGALASHGIHRDRIELRGQSTLAKMLEEYGDIDLALDAIPYSGCATSLHALAMGVPLVTLPGQTMVSRQSLAILQWLGIGEWVATSDEDYIARVVALALDTPLRTRMRRELRTRMLQSTLGDPKRFIQGVEQALRQMWIEGYARGANA